MKKYISSIFFILSVLVLHFTPLNEIHGRSDAAIIVGIFGLVGIVVSHLFKFKTLNLIVSLGYLASFLLAVLTYTTTTDPILGSTNNLWVIWVYCYWVMMIIASGIDLYLKVKSKLLKK